MCRKMHTLSIPCTQHYSWPDRWHDARRTYIGVPRVLYTRRHATARWRSLTKQCSCTVTPAFLYVSPTVSWLKSPRLQNTQREQSSSMPSPVKSYFTVYTTLSASG